MLLYAPIQISNPSYIHLQVVKKDKVTVKSREDVWALRFLNFISGANQLIFDGVTREIPL